MRILHIGKYYPPHHGGIETALAALATELVRVPEVSLEVWVSSSDRSQWLGEIGGVRLRRFSTWATFAGSPISPAMLPALRQTRPDLVHTHWPHPLAAAMVLASGYKGPWVISWHSDIVRQKWLSRLLSPWQTAMLRRASVICPTSAAYARSSLALAPWLGKCEPVPLGLLPGPSGSRMGAAVAAIRRQWGSPLLLSVGRLVYYKGFEYLIEAMRQTAARLLLIGEGPLRERLQAQIRAAGLRDRVILVGEVEDIEPYFHACDVFILPSIERSEAFGLVQVEAMSAGKPVINTALPTGVPEVSLHAVTGLTVPPRDAAALAAAMNRLLGDPDLRQALGQAGRQRAVSEFTAARMAARTLDIYRRLLASAPLAQASSGASL